jgi:uncharacterized protein YcbX
MNEIHAFPLPTTRQEEKGEEIGRVVSLHVYPVKSCKGIEVQASLVEARGLILDRLWMIVTSTGTFRTQRQIPKMTLIQPNLPSSLSAVSWEREVPGKGKGLRSRYSDTNPHSSNKHSPWN